MRYSITAPTTDDETIAGVHFAAGCATATDPDEGALLYFRRHGYEVEQLDDDPGDAGTEDTGMWPAGDSSPAPSTSKGRTARAK
ncbi:hypothetical protein [Streptomyces sp. NRRL B-24484]|uniref:hypothetical protein n=1 Tax=Streptomyces sp. NRRL B-24484 TaxID=1463833 RepID=UPI0004C0850E|nr:hypothetical protein [Streptomyces sp. NRRL B-24484]